jgi:hypothetical protein
MDSLRIGPFTFKVEFGKPVGDEGRSIDGRLWHSHSTIVINSDLHEQPRKQTLLHEIVHEIAIQAGQEITEGMVDAIAFGWYQVMRDNPDLVRMIRK